MQIAARANQVSLKLIRQIAIAAKADAVKESTGPIQDDMDEFTKEFMSKRIHLTEVQRFILGAGSSVAALINPRR